jgi:hypothetical protein
MTSPLQEHPRDARRVAIVVATIAFLFTWTLTTHGKYSVSGDEPHYLMVTHSLVADRDLDLANNYADDDGRWFGHDSLEAGPHVRRARTGQLLSVHDIGLPIILTPAYLAAQRLAALPTPALLSRVRMSRGLFAYSIVSVSVLVVIALSIGLLTTAFAGAAAPRTAAFLMVIVAISPPVVSYSFLVFPEAPALFVTALVVWFVMKPREGGDASTMLWLIAALGVLPWMHRKYSFYAFGLLFALLWMAPAVSVGLSRRQRLTAAGLFVLPQLAFHAWTYREWGTLGGPQLIEGLPFTSTGWTNGLIGLWIDRQSGLLANAPFYWIVPVCWAATWRRTWPLVVPVLLLYLPMAAFVEWWGGFSPGARYLAPIIPLLVVPIALALGSRFVQIVALTLGIAQLAIDAAIWRHPRSLWPLPSTNGNAALQELGIPGRAYELLLPAIRTNGAGSSAILILLGIVGFSVAIAASRFHSAEAAAHVTTRTSR